MSDDSYDNLHSLLSLSGTLMGHPKYSALKAQVDKELDEMAGRLLKKKEPAIGVKPAPTPSAPRAFPSGSQSSEGGYDKPTAKRTTYDGMPGPAEPIDPNEPGPDAPNVDRRL
jgi:hypothetical protein